MSVTIKRIPGVESVTTSLNKGRATIQLKPGNSVGLEQILERVRNNGFTPREARVTALGEVIYLGGKLQLKIADQNYEIETQAVGTSEELMERAGATLLVEGVIPPSKDKKPVLLIRVKSFRNSSGL